MSHCNDCAPEFFCWSGKSTCAKRLPSPAVTSIEAIIAETRAMVAQTYNREPRDSAVILSLATDIHLLLGALDRAEETIANLRQA